MFNVLRIMFVSTQAGHLDWGESPWTRRVFFGVDYELPMAWIPQ